MAQPTPSLYALDPALPVMLSPAARSKISTGRYKAFGGADSLIGMGAKLREI